MLALAHGVAHAHTAAVASLACSTAAVVLGACALAAPSVRGTCLLLALVQHLGSLACTPRVLMLTCGAEGASVAAHGGAWGFARVVRLEHPALHTQSAQVSCVARESAVAVVQQMAAEGEVAWRGEALQVARLRACTAASVRGTALGRGAYAITGGLGGLGLRAAALLVEGGACGVVLASRSGRVGRDGQGLQGLLTSLASGALVAACDGATISDLYALRAAIPLVGVLHAAGLGGAGLVVELEAFAMEWMHAPKAVGAWYLHCVASGVPREAHVLYSSVGAGLGNRGQASYGAANACLDVHAQAQRAHGMVACALQWPLIGGAGMGAAVFAAVEEKQVRVAGLAGIALEECIVAEPRTLVGGLCSERALPGCARQTLVG